MCGGKRAGNSLGTDGILVEVERVSRSTLLKTKLLRVELCTVGKVHSNNLYQK